jgi:hypothetical protein
MNGYEISETSQKAVRRLEMRIRLEAALVARTAFAGILSEYGEDFPGGLMSELCDPDGSLPSVEEFAAVAAKAVEADRSFLWRKGMLEV